MHSADFCTAALDTYLNQYVLVHLAILFLLRSGSARRRQPKNRKESFDMELAKLRTEVDPGLFR